MFNSKCFKSDEKSISLDSLIQKYHDDPKCSLSITDRFILVYMIARKLKEDHSNNIYRKYIIPKNVILNFQKNPIQIEINSNLNDDDDDDDDINSFSALEVLKDNSNNDFRNSDIYSFGLLTHYIFTGKKQFENKNQKEIIQFLEKNMILNIPEELIPAYFRHMISLTLDKNQQERIRIEKIVEFFDLGFVFPSIIKNKKENNYFKQKTNTSITIKNLEEARKLEHIIKVNEKNNKIPIIATFYLADHFNCPIAQREIGKLYYYGNILPKDGQKSYKYFQISAETNDVDPEGLFYFGQTFLNEIGIEKNEDRAHILIDKSARLGHQEAKDFIKIHYSTRYEYSSSPKVIILGQVGVGKTTFVKKIKNMYDCSYTVPTLSSEIHNIPYNNKDDKKKCFTIEDTHGMERYNALPNIIYRDASLAIIMFSIDCRNSFHFVDYAINHMRSLAGDIPIIILGNKMENKRSVHYNEAVSKAMQYNAKYIEVSCTNGSNVTYARDIIVEKAYSNADFNINFEPTTILNEQPIEINNVDKNNSCCIIA